MPPSGLSSGRAKKFIKIYFPHVFSQSLAALCVQCSGDLPRRGSSGQARPHQHCFVTRWGEGDKQTVGRRHLVVNASLTVFSILDCGLRNADCGLRKLKGRLFLSSQSAIEGFVTGGEIW
jgi:hypothetical protein